MLTGRLKQLLEQSRWRPYQLGGLALLVIYFGISAFIRLCLYPWRAGLGVFWKTPLRKTISTALMLATVVPLVVVFPMLYGARQP